MSQPYSDPEASAPELTTPSPSSQSWSTDGDRSDGEQLAYEYVEGGTFVDQFLAIMERTFRQVRRNKVDFVLECIIPLLFVIITLILWAVFPPQGGTEEQFVTYDLSLNTPTIQSPMYTQMVCYGDPDHPIATLFSCDQLKQSQELVTGEPVNISCVGNESEFPEGISSLCYIALDSSRFDGMTISGKSIGDLEGAMVTVQTWLQSYNSSFFTIPVLDEVIIYQLLARKASSGNDIISVMVNAGLLPNTRQTSVRCSGLVYFVGTGEQVNFVRQYFYHMSSLFEFVDGGIYTNIEAARSKVRNTRYNWAIIELKKFDQQDFDVIIHTNSTSTPANNLVINQNYAGGYNSERADLYAVSGFLTMQKLITEYYIRFVALDKNSTPEVPFNQYFVSAGFVDYVEQPLLAVAMEILPFIYVLAFLYPVSQLCKRIVLEKELRIREAMMIMGLGNTPMYLSWYVSFMVPNLFLSIITCVILKLSYIKTTDAMILVLNYVIYTFLCVPLAGFFSSFFSKARLASLLTPLIYFVFAVPVFAITQANAAIITVFCIFPPTAFAVAMLNVVQHETSGGFGSTSWNNPLDEPRMVIVFVMLAVDFVLFNLLMLYLDAVLPKDWGTPKHPLFFIIDPIRYCCCDKNDNLEGGADGRSPDGVFEETESIDIDAVQLVGLRKEYKRGNKKFLAVNNLYWGMQEGEISVLLGHNGAGKTTTMNMMTGMIEPDEGDCVVYGLSVRQQLSEVRQQIGFCPQHNILWPELTCRDHLEFFGKIKGLKGEVLEDAVCRMLHETDLLEKMDQPAKSLSGGQKRKLSVAIAFVSTSRLVFLDEPTAGMDVGARRYTWELLRRMSESHTILLTTHYMDEADLLGHRIGIMSQGRLKCSGSSMFLKSRLGVGYSITMSLESAADTEDITDMVLSAVSGAAAMGINGCEAMYRLPNSSVEEFPALLETLESEKSVLGVRGYSLSATTLEEVFLRVSEDDIVQQQLEDPLMRTTAAVIRRQENRIWNCEILEKRSSVLWSQFKTSMLKRLLNGLRDRRMQFFQVVCPMICILIAMLLSLISLAAPDNLAMDAGVYRGTYTMATSGCDALLGTDLQLDDFSMEPLHYLNALNVSWFMVDTFKETTPVRVGALVCHDPDFANMSVTSVNRSIIHFSNSSAAHQAPISMNAFYSAYLSERTGRDIKLSLTGGTMPRKLFEEVTEDLVKTILMGAIIMIPFTFLPSNPVAWVVKERECKSRHLQNVSGLSFYIYWLTNFLFDIAAYIVTMLLVIVIFLLFGRSEYIAADRIGGTFVLFLVYGFSSTAAAYLCSFAFSEHSTAQTVVMAVSFVSGFLLVMIVYIMSLMENTKDVAKAVRWATRIIPSFSIGEGIINMAILQQQQAVGVLISTWSMDNLGWVCIYMAAEFPIFMGLTLFIDHPIRRRWGQERGYRRNAEPQVISDEDSDVEAERSIVYDSESRDDNDDMVRMVDLRKVYPNGKEAVRNLTFGVVPGEVFGFLGTNGAGKTTAISILCQEFLPTSGTASVCGYDVVRDNIEALQCIGYCPQFDATIDLLTVEEHLRLYAGVRGIVYEQRDDVVGALLRLCELSMYRRTLSAELSGGNRRKLSFAMSLIGGPSVVFLDEPSAGMDPVARRGLWNAIEKVAGNSSVVLTTHHLEEVEALAHRVAIMVDGSLRCIGDKTHLKTKYGTGYEMSIRVGEESDCAALRSWVIINFPSATLNECKSQRFVYMLPSDSSMAAVFRSLQAVKQELNITDYSVSQTSIEQVFLKISGELEELENHPLTAHLSNKEVTTGERDS